MGTKINILIILLLISGIAKAQLKPPIIISPGGSSTTSGNTTGQGVFNIISYGAVSDSVGTDNTQPIQDAVNAAHVKGGIVYIPAGYYRTNKITTYTNVTIKGDGMISSFLRSISADTMFVIYNLANALAGVPYQFYANNLIEDIYLDGMATGTVGFYAQRAGHFRIGRTMFWNFKRKALVLEHTLIGTIDNCHFYYDSVGVQALSNFANNTATTFITLRDCIIIHSLKWGIDYQGGGMLRLQGCNFENNGQVTDSLTGSVWYHGNPWPGGLTVDGCWLEENLGTNFYISGNTNPAFGDYPVYTTHSIMNTQDLGQQYAFTKRNIAISGNNQRLGIINSTFSGAISSVVADGTGSNINVIGSVLKNSNLIRGGAVLTTTGN